ncbi:MAG: nucleotide exchange factor GrpE [Candidatus Nealsonbacteria bacterium CG23_combo_of_CG06-09_8_20_14_all_40_13]|uniref:Protein GrpE n=1 Tax=Candidatus Nealsonbacteria bacterium CG23_combo_of_CG06-09_8_20_14_all_40_13 TaxID=1974724 RepID=A0A2G9YSB2_9BACT|nr:MAG: nucleotide exchange factor GrpE [Candidatus Nealsonbacteria bacterium CG23_combo_of_CG06-09_8_20_14_all_40_13]PIR71048.1 MAG: nucleotide exchange factor GrpE [Candidatus Nealsonbacteria bacterium CG10_big_fil_rev_8_21_14_0_10_40_24]PIU43183.1 MAG: nucleotide exchange factor GrpE [Candidatus Nealsonbacteria bacterium CG07_land_8_20_14_0_80_40_10]
MAKTDIVIFERGNDIDFSFFLSYHIYMQGVSMRKSSSFKGKKIKELENDLKRLAADFANYRKRQDELSQKSIRSANTDLILKIIPILDSFRRAFAHIPDKLTNNKWVEGVKNIDKQLENILNQEGVKRIDVSHSKFDPHFHEAILYQENKKIPEGYIVCMFENGYTLYNQVIKPAKVIVSKGK